MLHSRFPLRLSIVLLLLVAAGDSDADARRRRPPARKSSKVTTIVSLELITTDNTAGFQTRLWTGALQKLKISFRIRRGTSADKLGILETKRGNFRTVKVTGKLDRIGRLIFKDRVFKRGDDARLAEWIRELQTYGGQGAPAGKPLWGLSKAQFGEVYAALSRPVSREVHGGSLGAALKGLGLPSDYPVRFSVAGNKAKDGESGTVRKTVKGQSLGTALALVLRDFGLGFRPLRTPRGNIELVVDPLDVARDAWPIGWKLRASRPQTAPRMFQLIPVELENVKLTDLFAAVTAKTGIPIHVDYRAARAKRIAIDKLVVSYGRRKTSWSLLLRSVTARNRLTRTLRIDEAGNPFVWITVFGSATSR
ncbi:MAG: hypothetical protein ACE5KM_01225 [Planctomycetaceae bacterium]